MSYTATYLNFESQTEEAFSFYKEVFGGEYEGDIARFGDIPSDPSQPQMDDATKSLVMHVCLPILGGHKLMGSDVPKSMGFELKTGNNFYISLHPDSREQADELFAKLSHNGNVEMVMQDMFWGAYYGSLRDQYGVGWMIHHEG